MSLDYGSYRVRLYPPFRYSSLYKEYNLTGFNHQTKRYLEVQGSYVVIAHL